MLTYIATFGAGHPMKNQYIGIIAENAEAARFAMFKTFGQKWGFIYEANDPEHGVRVQEARWGIKPSGFLVAGHDSYHREPQIRTADQDEFELAMRIETKFGGNGEAAHA
jgi:hypothetical protein